MSQTQNPQVKLLIEAISEAIQQKTHSNTVNILELLEAISTFLSLISRQVSDVATSLDQLTRDEQIMVSVVMQAIRPYFENKRQVLLAQRPPADGELSKEQILEQVKQMLFNKSLTPDEGLALVGELVSAITYLRSPTVQSPDQIKQIETITLNFIKGKLSLALDAIQAEQGFVTKQ